MSLRGTSLPPQVYPYEMLVVTNKGRTKLPPGVDRMRLEVCREDALHGYRATNSPHPTCSAWVQGYQLPRPHLLSIGSGLPTLPHTHLLWMGAELHPPHTHLLCMGAGLPMPSPQPAVHGCRVTSEASPLPASRRPGPLPCPNSCLAQPPSSFHSLSCPCAHHRGICQQRTSRGSLPCLRKSSASWPCGSGTS